MAALILAHPSSLPSAPAADPLAGKRILIGGFGFDPLRDSPQVPAALRGAEPRSGEQGYALLQLPVPPDAALKRRLLQAGITPLHYVNYDAFIVRAEGGALASARATGLARWVGPFHPAYTLSPDLALEHDAVLNGWLEDNLGGRPGARWERIDTSRQLPVRVVTMEPIRAAEVATAVERLGGRGIAVFTSGTGLVRAEIPRSALQALARQPGILWIERESPNHTMNDIARWVIQSNDPVSYSTPVHDHLIHGTGQIVTVGDTGLDFQHDAFEDPAHPTVGADHRKVTDYYIPSGALGDTHDNGFNNHGTHVSGTVAGDDGIWHAYEGDPQGLTASLGPHDGQAFDATLQMQDISTDGTYVFPPADFHGLFFPARDRGSWIHTNSWGGCCTGYGNQDRDIDDFVFNNPDFVALFAAGNDGPALRTLSLQASAKNLIAVGGTGNGTLRDQIMYCPSRGRYCSSRGPTSDGRLKPDILAPGEDIWSARGCDTGPACDDYWQLTGTSMATPTAAGAAALVRQYFMDGFYPSGRRQAQDGFTPSAALVKAVLVNGATEITGDTAYVNNENRYPNNNQGWGRILLDSALYFEGDRRELRVDDNRVGLATGESIAYDLAVLGTEDPVEITLVWSDSPGTPGSPPYLVNDLDLELAAPDGTSYRGNRFIGSRPGQSEPNPAALSCPERSKAGDCLNNVEGILVISNLQLGTWTVTVRGATVPQGQGGDGRQPYALVMTDGRSPRAGAVQFDRVLYRSSAGPQVNLSDTDLNRNPLVTESATVQLTSDTETAPETITLMETGPASGLFSGTVQLAASNVPVAGDGRLQVRNHDQIRVAYFDADDGSGSSRTAIDTATIDDDAPVISGTRLSALKPDRAIVEWTTGEAADSTVRYGISIPPASVGSSATRVIAHSVTLTGLSENTTYFYRVESTDAQGNTGIDDNGGAHYSFTTPRGPVTPAADSQTGPGTIYQGSYLNLRVSDDVHEVLRETKQGTKSRLVHTWRFDGVPAGLDHRLLIEGYRPQNQESEDFQFYSSTDGVNFTSIPGGLIASIWEYQADPDYGAPFGSGSQSGTFYIRVQDTNTVSGTALDTVHIDYLAIATSAILPCIDADGDGYTPNCSACGNGLCPLLDCDDGDPLANPGRSEGPAGDPTCSDGRDNDCNGLKDAADATVCSAAFHEARATADHQTGPGRISFGSYLSTQVADTVYEGLEEGLVGSKSRLTHVWRFNNVPTGTSHVLRIRGARPPNSEGDDFQFSWSSDGSSFSSIPGAVINDYIVGAQEHTFGTGALSGTLYIRVQDTKANGNRLDLVYVDELLIRTQLPQPACADADGDGYAPTCAGCGNANCPAIDCDDADPLASPARVEGPPGSASCNDARDNDCDGAQDPLDAGCAFSACDYDGLCEPGENSCGCPSDCGLPPEEELYGVTCADGLDNDCDGTTDAIDPDCASPFDILVPSADASIQWLPNDGIGPNFDEVNEGFPADDLATAIYMESVGPLAVATDEYELTNTAYMKQSGRTTRIEVRVRANTYFAVGTNDHALEVSLVVAGQETSRCWRYIQGTWWTDYVCTMGDWDLAQWSRSQVDGMRLRLRGTARAIESGRVTMAVSAIVVRVRSTN